MKFNYNTYDVIWALLFFGTLGLIYWIMKPRKKIRLSELTYNAPPPPNKIEVLPFKQIYILQQFSKSMKAELEANIVKGDWTDWKDIEQIDMEITYHQQKLYKAIEAGDKKLIKEHIADVANFYMMLGNAFDLYCSGERQMTDGVIYVDDTIN